MNKTNLNQSLLLKLAVSGSAILGVNLAVAQEAFFIEHKPTDSRFESCSTLDGAPIQGGSPTASSECAQWVQVANGSFFHLQNVSSGKYIRPANRDNGAAIELRPNTWTGSWTQWSYDDRGDGHGHLVNRATGKYVYLPASGGDLQQQPSAWRGDYTRWALVPVSNATPVPSTPTPVPATPTPAPAGDDVEISNNNQFGDFLVGGQGSSQPGFTLYTFANDNGGPNSVCNGQCAVVWPPLIVDSANDVNGPASLNFGTTTRNDGSIQVTFNNEPLYFYNEDNNPGDTNGHNVGGVWFVAEVGGTPPTPAPQTPTPNPSTPDPVPTCTPGPAATNNYEAESGSILGSASVYDDGAASGGQGVAFISTQNAGFSVSTNQGAASSFVIRYASELSGSISYRINQVDSGNVSFSSTGAWVGSYTDVTVNANVPAGASIDVFYDGGDTAMNVDYISMTSSGCGGNPPTPVPPTPGPGTPNPDPVDTPTPTPPTGDDFGFESNGLIWFKAQPEWPTSGTFYSCRDLEQDCFPASLNNGRWEHVHSNLAQGQSYTAQLKVPGLGADQFPRYDYTWNHPSIGNNPGPGPGPGAWSRSWLYWTRLFGLDNALAT